MSNEISIIKRKIDQLRTKIAISENEIEKAKSELSKKFSIEDFSQENLLKEIQKKENSVNKLREKRDKIIERINKKLKQYESIQND